MIEVLQFPSGPCAVTMDNQLVMVVNYNDFPNLQCSELLIQVSENLSRITGQPVNVPTMKEPAQGWEWKDVLIDRSIAIQYKLEQALAELAAADITIVINDAEDGFYVVMDEVDTPECRGLTSDVYDTKEQAIMEAHDYLKSLANTNQEAPAPGR